MKRKEISLFLVLALSTSMVINPFSGSIKVVMAEESNVKREASTENTNSNVNNEANIENADPNANDEAITNYIYLSDIEYMNSSNTSWRTIKKIVIYLELK